MVNKQIQYSFGGANQDVTKSKHPFQFYYEASHIRITSTDSQSTGSITNEKGNKFKLSIPDVTINSQTITYDDKTLPFSPVKDLGEQISSGDIELKTYTDNEFIGHTVTRDGVILFSTNDEGLDCIWYLKEVIGKSNYELELLYTRKLGFSKNNPIQAIFNYENQNIQKVYWVDGINQIRFINIVYENIEDNESLIDVPATSLDFVGEVNFSQAELVNISNGGSHTSGMIQYTYNLYRLNGAQTKIAPLSSLIPLSKGDNLGGGEVNEVVGSSPTIKISNIDDRYTHIKIYAVKYTSYNELPSVSLIDERKLDSTELTILDDGINIESLSLEEFLFLGSDPLIAKHIEAKDNRLFPVNITGKEFVLPDTLDFRAYSFNESGESQILDSVTDYTNQALGTGLVNVNSDYNVPKKHSTINRNYDVYKYQRDGATYGGEGKYLSYSLVQSNPSSIDNPEGNKYFKDNEIYRIGIELYNNLGQISLPQWIADFKARRGNLEGNLNTLSINLKPEFFSFINTYQWESEDLKPVGYKIIRANRTAKDKTILYQGAISNMMYQHKNHSDIKDYGGDASEKGGLHADSSLKVPSPLIRHQRNYPSLGNDNSVNYNLARFGGWVNRANHLGALASEFFIEDSSEYKLQYPWQHDKMLQLYSPEIIFDGYQDFSTGLEVEVIGMANNTNNNAWYEERAISTKNEKHGGKLLNALNIARLSPDSQILENNDLEKASRVHSSLTDYGSYGFIAPAGSEKNMNFRLYAREYLEFVSSKVYATQPIYGKPEFTERGQGFTLYNKDGKYKYSNSLQPLITDNSEDDKIVPLTSVNSFGSRCITFVMGNQSTSSQNRYGSQNLYYGSKLEEKPDCNGEGILICEIKKSKKSQYLTNIYGGNTYEDKKRTEYIKIGEYTELDYNDTSSSINILSPGDTFVQDFNFMRIGKTDTEVYASDSLQMTEILTYPTETTIDLRNRNDNSFGEWDSIFQPRYDDYHKYNKVYSQEPSLYKNRDVDFNFKRINDFDTRIRTTKLKIPNESIDSWTDYLENESMDLNGKYGPINGLVSFNDNLYTFQDEAISMLQINPRVQVQATDGVGIELGTGGILYDHNYITTKSGSINKWGIVAGKKGIYYYDALNKAVGRVPDATQFFLSDMKGMHSFYSTNYNYTDLKVDNPLLKQGALFSFDNYNNDLYFSLLQRKDVSTFNTSESVLAVLDGYAGRLDRYAGRNDVTWRFNELRDEFIDLKKYYPTMLISKSDKLLAIDNNKDLYEQYAGEYNNFFGEYLPSYVILQLNPESNYDTVFNNIHYNSEIYLNDIDQPSKTLTHIQAYNEYQDSGRIPLVVGRSNNLRRKFREWQADIPRDGRNRIRNPWIFLKLELENESNYRMILHDIIVKYSV